MKEIKNLLLSKPFLLPQEFPDNSEFRYYLIAKLLSFQSEVEKIISFKTSTYNGYQKKIISTVLDSLNNSVSSIINVINLYYNGFPDRAYTEFLIFLNNLNNKKLIPVDNTIWKTNFYRVRPSSKPLIERKQLFHIALNDRTIIKTQRYSISGFPCLYLSNSPFVCWHECGNPNLNECYFSLFKLTNPLTFLDFRVSNFYNDINKGLSDWKQLVMVFPLHFISNIKVKKTNDPFKPEYIFTQFTTRWCKETSNGFDGVLYNSTKITYDKKDGELFNLSIPVLHQYSSFETSPSYCDKLAKNLIMTKPFGKKEISKGKSVIKFSSLIKYIPLLKGSKKKYNETFFYTVESFLNNQDVDVIEFS